MPRPRLPFPINAAFIAVGALIVGAKAATTAAPTVLPASTLVEQGSVRTVTSTTRVTRRVHGHVIHRNHKVYVLVPMIVVRTDDHIIRVPAHKLPLRSAAATVANPLVTVHVLVPTTVYVPTTVTETVTTTDIVPTTVTISVPLGSSQ